ncbi:MAG TPA: phage baseplate assembly protein V [Solirubrobacteraceae bacterium]|jgi:uncharacterized protein involved in type VI secretion and phage assembly|nr:phage baseplate assembly protein V [Solirubrobacteraceae bacterium]
MSPQSTYYGKYRGTVVNNIDPLQLGRIMAIVPDVSAVLPTSWAMPAYPVGGLQYGIVAAPLVGAGVWIEFEQGNPDYPIWTGCYYGTAAEVPSMTHAVPPGVPGITLQTPLQNSVTISDTPGPTGGIVMKTTTGALITVNATGIVISNGQGASISMVGPTITVTGIVQVS